MEKSKSEIRLTFKECLWKSTLKKGNESEVKGKTHSDFSGGQELGAVAQNGTTHWHSPHVHQFAHIYTVLQT